MRKKSAHSRDGRDVTFARKPKIIFALSEDSGQESVWISNLERSGLNSDGEKKIEGERGKDL